METENIAFIGLGSNLGNRVRHLDQARAAVQQLGAVAKSSSIWETVPWGKKDQDAFYNQVLMVKTKLDADKFLDKCQQIEMEMGRKRDEKWGPRTLDIDILFWNQEVRGNQQLQIPHPYAHQRAFVLGPLLEIAPEFQFPNGKTALEYWQALSEDERDGIRKICENSNS